MAVKTKQDCRGCFIYEERFWRAETLNRLFGHNSTWNFETCKRGCRRKYYDDEYRKSQWEKEHYGNL